MDYKILFVSHKKYDFPKGDIYYPIQVGSALTSERFFNQDNIGDNISNKNDTYCELTGLYRGYKNLKCDFLGLVHYRRVFAKNNFCFKKDYKNCIDKEHLNKIFSKYDIILPKKRHYWIESNYSHFIHAHNKESLDLTRDIIKNDYPEISIHFEKMLNKRSMHLFNMFIAPKKISDEYCKFCFDVLLKLEGMINIDEYNNQEKRVFGYIGEYLIDPFIMYKKLKVKEQKYIFMEKMHWLKKIYNFLKRKFHK